jgi:hypothetical protein
MKSNSFTYIYSMKVINAFQICHLVLPAILLLSYPYPSIRVILMTLSINKGLVLDSGKKKGALGLMR